ncbi:MAG: nucleotidyltransferase substrate binding protein [Elusimicrobiota bacterium]|jgi:nucleotidyltransferase substrate binding protein (TIGR01987 family)|nr:nucleotidyltransferase substrate binding protein [Elusimicrobiota bacterium]
MHQKILDLAKLEKALKSFDRAVKASQKVLNSKELDIKETVRAGLIQNFEFTFELCWKFIQRYLELNNQISKIIPKKQLFREAFENGLIKNPETWFEYLEARNKTAHIYGEEASDIVYALSKKFSKDAKELLRNLDKINE